MNSEKVPFFQKKSVKFGLLLLFLHLAITTYYMRQTARSTLVSEAVRRLNENSDAVQILDSPITASNNISGEVKEDETGWREARLVIPVHGPKGEASARVVAGGPAGKRSFPFGARKGEQWQFTTFEVLFEKQHKKLDLVAGRIVDIDPTSYADVHTQAAVVPDATYLTTAPTMSGKFPCAFAVVGRFKLSPQVGECEMPTTPSEPVDRFEADFRYGRFILRETDLFLKDVFDVPLTRTYASIEWGHNNPVHAFGQNTNHPFDLAPVGSRNPYTYIMLLLEDGDYLYFKRISKGTGYADAVYQHVETATRFYKATFSWNGNGWTVTLADGTTILFPESYNAKNIAQGAATEIRSPSGDRLELRRDGQRNLLEIRTPHGHTVKFSYDDHDRIVRAEDDSHNWAQYRYNRAGLLSDVIYSSGKERHYEYDGVLMTWIQAENGRVLLHNSYDEQGLLKRQDFGNGNYLTYDYQVGNKFFLQDSVSVRFPNGKTKTLQLSQAIPDSEKHPPQHKEERPRGSLFTGMVLLACGLGCLYLGLPRKRLKPAAEDPIKTPKSVWIARAVYTPVALAFFYFAVRTLTS